VIAWMQEGILASDGITNLKEEREMEKAEKIVTVWFHPGRIVSDIHGYRNEHLIRIEGESLGGEYLESGMCFPENERDITMRFSTNSESMKFQRRVSKLKFVKGMASVE